MNTINITANTLDVRVNQDQDKFAIVLSVSDGKTPVFMGYEMDFTELALLTKQLTSVLRENIKARQAAGKQAIEIIRKL